MAPCIELIDVGLKYLTVEEEVEALYNVNLTVDEGSFVSVIGPSGCGKSSLLSLISGLILPTEGQVFIDGDRIDGPTQKVGYMLQHDHLFPWRTVLRNCTLGLEIQNRLSEGRIQFIKDMLRQLRLEDKILSFPHKLSGGQKQRVALVRTLAFNPEFVLLDEPFSALDYPTRLQVQNDVFNILREQGKTVILVTHDLPEAIAMSDYIVMMTNAPGTVHQIVQIDIKGYAREPLARRASPKFGSYFRELWTLIQHQIDGDGVNV